MLLSHLPTEMKLPTGEVLKPYVGHLKKREIISYCRENKKKFRQVNVLATRLRGVTDLHGNLYKPSQWVFVEL